MGPRGHRPFQFSMPAAPHFYPPLLWGSEGKARTPEADDILALEHTFYADKNRQLPDKMSTRYTTLPNYTA